MLNNFRVATNFYEAALRIKNGCPYSGYKASQCSMGIVAAVTQGVDEIYHPSGMTCDKIGISAEAIGVSKDTFNKFFRNVGMSRKKAVSNLREEADAFILSHRKNSKMNRAALLAAATFIEDNPSEYDQNSTKNCMIGIAKNFAKDSDLGLTTKQYKKLFWFRYDRTVTVSGYDKFRALPIEERAKVAAARLRRMAYYGT